MKPRYPALTSGQKPIGGDQWGAFALLVILLFALLPWQTALLCLGTLFGIACPFVLLERRMIAEYNAGRPWRRYEWLSYLLTGVALAAILVIHLHRLGLLDWWPR